MNYSVRKLNLLDFSGLIRQPDSLTCLDGLRMVIHGGPLSVMGMASTMFAQSHSGMTLEQDGKTRAIGRVVHWQEEDFAQLQFISADDPKQDNLTALIEALLIQAGEWGLTRVMADLPMSSPYMSAFRRAHFINWSSYKAYTFPCADPVQPKPSRWRAWTSKDFDGIKAVYQSLVRPQIRDYEPMTRSKVIGKVLCNENGKIIAYADLDYGSKGLWAQVFAEVEAGHPGHLSALSKLLYAEYGRPITFTARSYMPWLRLSWCQFEEQASEERALIVRHLTVKDLKPEPSSEKILEKRPAEGGFFSANSQK